MRDDEIRRQLADANPWWAAGATGTDPSAWTRPHRLLRDRANYDLGYRSNVLQDVETGPITDRLVVLTGPRRVGKSVALIDAAAALCQRADVDPRQVILVQCDGMQARDLRRAITLSRELTKVIDRSERRRRVWLLDEVGSVKGWTSVLKLAREGDPLGDDTVVVTSSRWHENEDVEGNLMAGRAGTSGGRRLRILLPMTFRAFLAATRPDIPLLTHVHPAILMSAAVAEELETVRFHVDQFDLAWQDYLTCGGFPRAVSEYSNLGAVSEAYQRDLVAWLRADIDPELPPESIPILLATLSGCATSPLNVTDTAAQLGYTRDVFERRLARLTAAFATVWCPQRKERGEVVVGAQSKLYLTDPLLAWLPSRLRAGLARPNMTALTEMAIGVSLARLIDDLDEGRWVTSDTIGFARTGSGHEVDLGPIPIPTSSGIGMTIPIESKWVDAGWRGEAVIMERKFGAGVIATKSILDLDNRSWAIPAPMAALLLG